MTGIDIIKLIATFLGIGGAIWAALWFDNHCEEKFSYRFIKNKKTLFIFCICFISLVGWGKADNKAIERRPIDQKAQEVEAKIASFKRMKHLPVPSQSDKESMLDKQIGNYTAKEWDRIATTLILLSLSLYIYIGYCNIRNTNWTYGIFGSIVQLPFLIVASLASFIGIVLVVVCFVSLFAPRSRTVYVE